MIHYIADLPVTRLRLLTIESDNIASRKFAAFIHRLARFQLTSPLAYNIAQLFELRLFRLASTKLMGCSTPSRRKINISI